MLVMLAGGDISSYCYLDIQFLHFKNNVLFCPFKHTGVDAEIQALRICIAKCVCWFCLEDTTFWTAQP